MQKVILCITFFLALTCHLMAVVKTLDWISLEAEACILEHTIIDLDEEFFPLKNLENKDLETKMPEIGFFNSFVRITISYYSNLCQLTPYVIPINSFSGFTNLANAP